MVLELTKFQNIISISNNSNESDILEKIKNELRKLDESQYQEWEKTGFNPDHKFIVEDYNITYELTLLSIAAKGGYKVIVNTLIKKGADVNIIDEDGMTPLHRAILKKGNRAILKKSKKLVKRLIKAKADVNVADKYGRTPLYLAAKDNKIEIAKILIRAKANVNIDNEDGKTPLFLTIQNDDTKMAKVLIREGADIYMIDKYGKNFLYYAIVEGRKEIAKALIEVESDVNIIDERGRNFLHYAIEYNFGIDLVRELIKRGNDVNKKDQKKVSPLLLVTLYGYGVNKARKSIIRSAVIQNIEKPEGSGHHIYWNQCKDEIEDKVKKKIGKSMVSYLDLLKANENDIIAYVQDPKISKVLDNPNFEFQREFPIFGRDIKDKYYEGKRRLDALSVGETVIKHFSDSHGILDHCMEIAKHLSNKDIKNLRKAAIQTMDEKKDGSTSVDSNNDSPLNSLENSNAEVVVNHKGRIIT